MTKAKSSVDVTKMVEILAAPAPAKVSARDADRRAKVRARAALAAIGLGADGLPAKAVFS